MNERFDRLRWPERRTGYLVAMLAELATLRSSPFTTGSEVRHRNAVLVAVGNGKSYGNGVHMCPDAAVDDGLLDVTVVDDIPRRSLLRLLPSAYPPRTGGVSAGHRLTRSTSPRQ